MAKYYISQYDVIKNPKTIKSLWELYYNSFEDKINQSPCRQYCQEDEFMLKLANPRIIKYVISIEKELIGMALVASDPLLVNWIEPGYYEKTFPSHFAQGKIFYIIGFAVKPSHQGATTVATRLYKHILDTLPFDSIWCFDFSRNINPKMAHTLRRVGKNFAKNRQYLDMQIYIAFHKPRA